MRKLKEKMIKFSASQEDFAVILMWLVITQFSSSSRDIEVQLDSVIIV